MSSKNRVSVTERGIGRDVDSRSIQGRGTKVVVLHVSLEGSGVINPFFDYHRRRRQEEK